MNSWAADDSGLQRIWRTSILPLLEEYHVGEGLDVEKKYGLSTLRSALTPSDPVVTSESAD
jgi:5-methylcytosine-specific restriction protein B